METREHWPLTEAMTLHFLELPKLPPAPVLPDGPLLWKWGRFLTARTRDELEQLAMSDPVFDEAKRALEQLSADPAAQELVQEREIWAWNHEMQLRHARTEGKAEGKTEGRYEGERHLLRKQLVLKFGELPAGVVARLEHAERSFFRWLLFGELYSVTRAAMYGRERMYL